MPAEAISELPPSETNGSVTPVSGIRCRLPHTIRSICTVSSKAQPKAISA